MNKFDSADNVRDSSGRQYHIGLTDKEVSDKIILVGDPARAKLISKYFDEIRVKKENRQFVSFTGKYKGTELTVLSIGIGASCMEIAVIELVQLVYPLTIIRCGTCGALQNDINIGDLVISSAALRLENTSSFFVEESFPAVSDYEISIALMKSAYDLKLPYHYGLTATAPGFYGAQGRHIDGFPFKENDLIERLVKQNVKNLEMECATLLTLSTFRGFRAGAVCSVFASRNKNEFISPDLKKKAEIKAIKCVLNAFLILNKIDYQKGKNKFWIPEV